MECSLLACPQAGSGSEDDDELDEEDEDEDDDEEDEEEDEDQPPSKKSKACSIQASEILQHCQAHLEMCCIFSLIVIGLQAWFFKASFHMPRFCSTLKVLPWACLVVLWHL